jgi:hypothetical protein
LWQILGHFYFYFFSGESSKGLQAKKMIHHELFPVEGMLERGPIKAKAQGCFMIPDIKQGY